MIHAVHSNNMSDMGGLRKSMPITFWTMLIGSLALAGIFPLAGFWSKDELLVVAEEEHVYWLFVVFLITAVITAFYTMRMVLLTFFGEYKGHGASARVAGDDDRSARRSSPRPRVGVGLLGSPQLGAVFGQWVFFEEVHEAVFVPWIALLSTAGALLGLFAGYALYTAREGAGPAAGADGSPLERAPAPLLHRRLLHAGHRLSGARHVVGGRELVQPARARRRRERRRDARDEASARSSTCSTAP